MKLCLLLTKLRLRTEQFIDVSFMKSYLLLNKLWLSTEQFINVSVMKSHLLLSMAEVRTIHRNLGNQRALTPL